MNKIRFSTEPHFSCLKALAGKRLKNRMYPVDFIGELLIFYQKPYILTIVTIQVNDDMSDGHS
jgi:hypothetical protein